MERGLGTLVRFKLLQSFVFNVTDLKVGSSTYFIFFLSFLVFTNSQSDLAPNLPNNCHQGCLYKEKLRREGGGERN